MNSAILHNNSFVVYKPPEFMCHLLSNGIHRSYSSNDLTNSMLVVATKKNWYNFFFLFDYSLSCTCITIWGWESLFISRFPQEYSDPISRYSQVLCKFHLYNEYKLLLRSAPHFYKV